MRGGAFRSSMVVAAARSAARGVCRVDTSVANHKTLLLRLGGARRLASRPDGSFRTKKRFYESASAARIADEDGGGYAVQLDGRALKTPGKKNLVQVPTASLALALATEWDDQQDVVRMDAMPLMTLVCSALDLEERRREI